MYIEKVIPWQSAKWIAPPAAEIARIRKAAGTHDDAHAPEEGDAVVPDANADRGTFSGETERGGTPEGEKEVDRSSA